MDDETGRLYAAGSQHLLVPVGIVASIRGVLQKIAGDAASEVFMYRVGEDIGKEHANRAKMPLLESGVELDKEALLEQVYHSVMQSGWGTVEIEWIDPLENVMRIRGRNFPCWDIGGCCCALERGILAGAYHEIIGTRIYYTLAEKTDGVVVFDSQREIPAEVLRDEELSLLSKSELEDVIEEKIVEIARSNERFEQIARSSGD